jgi:hypothetical protein
VRRNIERTINILKELESRLVDYCTWQDEDSPMADDSWLSSN